MGFLVALHFLTTLPVPIKSGLPDDAWGRSMAYFPLAGLVVGASLVVAGYLLSYLWPAPIAAAGMLGLWVVITGALHLDGFADCCDGLLVEKSPTDRLAILHDPHIGTFGVAGLIVLLLLKYTCLLSGETAPFSLYRMLLLAPVLSRWAMVYAAVVFPYGRAKGSLGSLFVLHVSRRSLMVSSIAAIIIAGLVGGWFGLAALALTWIVMIGIARWTMTRIPGLTGDVYGAINELTELAVLLLATAWPA